MSRVSVKLARQKWHFKVQEVAPEAGDQVLGVSEVFVEGEEVFLAGLEVEEEVEQYLEALLREGEVHIEGEENQYLIVRDWLSRRKRKTIFAHFA